MKRILYLIGFLVTASAPAAYSHSGGMMGYGSGMMGGYGSYGIVGGLFMLVFWVAVILAVIWVIKEIFSKKNKDNSYSGQRTKSATEILKERYARGEITKEQYEQMKRDIM